MVNGRGEISAGTRPPPRAGFKKIIVLALCAALAGVAAALTPVGAWLEGELGLALLYAWRGERTPPSDVVVIALDRSSAEQLRLPGQIDRWPRTQHARLIDGLREHGAAVIVFDLLFKEAKTAEEDRALAASMDAAGNVILLEMLEGGAANPAAWSEKRLPPLPRLADAARGVAPMPLPKIPVRLDQYWTFKSEAGDLPTLPVTALALYGAHAYRTLIERYTALRPDAAARLPRLDPGASTWREARHFLQTLRGALMESPALTDELDTLAQTLPAGAARQARALLRACRGPGSRHLHLYGPPRTVTTLPYHEALTNPGAMDWRGKIVFVGHSERVLQAQRDSYHTVYSQADGSDIPGVEIIATAVANLLDDQVLQPVPPRVHLGAVFLFGLAAGALCMALGAGPAALALLLLMAGYAAFSFHAFAARAEWWPTAVPLLAQSLFAYGAALFWHHREQARARRRLKQAAGYYLPAQVVATLEGTGDAVRAGGQTMQGVCLASDAARYTTLSESLNPTGLSQLMNAYYEVLFAPVRRHGGIISDVEGDAMLALWPVDGDAAAARAAACRAALEIQSALDAFNAVAHRPALPTRLGLHSGEFVLGNVGALDHFEYRAVGDVVNTATRIQALNKILGTRTLASARVMEGLSGFAARPLGRFLLPGKQQPVEIHELPGAGHDPDHALFGEALAQFQAGRWRDAARVFDRFLAHHPGDGPARFYRGLCDRYQEQPPREWEGCVRLDSM